MAGSPAIDAANSGVANWPTTDARAPDGRRLPPPIPGSVRFYRTSARSSAPTIVNRAPVVSAPGTVKGTAGSLVTIKVTASDPDGDPIASLVMMPGTMPPNSGATFVTSADHKSGTFTWTPVVTGNFRVDFIAANVLADTASTTIQVKAKTRHDAIASGPEEGMGEVALSNGFPNPSRGAVEFTLDLPHEADVRWAVFDLQGRQVWSESMRLAAGRSSLRWDGSIAGGARRNGVSPVRASVDGVGFNRRVVRF